VASCDVSRCQLAAEERVQGMFGTYRVAGEDHLTSTGPE